ncbi:MAG: hypothetical protein ACRDOO_08675, partial [Actinomadura sp.]
ITPDAVIARDHAEVPPSSAPRRVRREELHDHAGYGPPATCRRCDDLGMGLNVVVGFLADGDDPDAWREEFADINAVVAAAGLPGWTEPALETPGEYETGGYSALHHLRRVAVHLAATGTLPPPGTSDAADDPLLEAAYADGAVPHHAVLFRHRTPTVVGTPADAAGRFDHLVFHSDCDGYYLPVDFAPVIVHEKVLGHYLGSSHRLLDECLTLAEHLGLPADLDPWSAEVEQAMSGEPTDPSGWQRYPTESFVCLQLIGAARHSITSGAAIVFC